MKKVIPIFAFLSLLILGVFYFFQYNSEDSEFKSEIAYSDFIKRVRAGKIKRVQIIGREIQLLGHDGEAFETYNPGDPQLINDLLDADVLVRTAAPQSRSLFMALFISWFPVLFLIAIMFFFLHRMQSRQGALGRNGKNSKAKMYSEEQVKVTFNDVAGCEEAKEDVVELVDFLKAPEKFEKLGGKIPRGVLMVGPPGTGKTLIARAVAGEAKVKFFSISGSDFVEMYVGVGAARVRELFAQAKSHAPCIIFIDEIDAVGRKRSSSGLNNSNEEREQTLNQLLVEMDGFEGSEGIIVIAATNRVDVLDDALLRPGRFDRQINVGLPDVGGREKILKVHLQKSPLSDDVKIRDIARGTPGFSGAELANLVNEAALFAARADKTEVNMSHLEKAKDKIMMGVEKHTMVMTPEDKRLTAYHEAGHCIVGKLMPDHDPVYKVSIMPRSGALGVTLFLPEKDQYSASKRKLEGQIASLFGGRIAERLIYGDDKVTTGASNDIERATDLARKMVTRWGLSDKIGPLSYGEERGQSAVSDPATPAGVVSGNVAQMIDEEIRSVIERNYQRAENILRENMLLLDRMADALMKWETIDQYQIDDLMSGKDARPPADYVEEANALSLPRFESPNDVPALQAG